MPYGHTAPILRESNQQNYINSDKYSYAVSLKEHRGVEILLGMPGINLRGDAKDGITGNSFYSVRMVVQCCKYHNP